MAVDIERELRALEEQLLDPEVRRSSERVSALLAEDFIEFSSAGVAYDRARILDVLRDEAMLEDPVSRSIVRFEVVDLGTDVVLTRYRLLRQRFPGEPASQSLRSSVWRRTAGGWRMIFHQGTFVSSPA
ncbi:MAG TPA: DUF4440 domain-containing protein [Usitatibacter sp.]|nr:DUF4440 domain-containing protein [Usitatibacter sp.]